MTDAAGIIARLDAAIERRGETIRLQRLTTGPEGTRIPFEVELKAIVRKQAPTDLVEAGATPTSVVISPTGLRAKRFPRLPRVDDRVYIQADPMNVVEVAPIYDGDELVRVRLTCRG